MSTYFFSISTSCFRRAFGEGKRANELVGLPRFEREAS